MSTPDKKFEAVLPDGKQIDIVPSNTSEAIKLIMDNLSPEERGRIALQIKAKKEGVEGATKEEGQEDDTEKQLLEIAREKKELEEQIKEDEKTIKKLKKRLEEIEEEIKTEEIKIKGTENKKDNLGIKEAVGSIGKGVTETLYKQLFESLQKGSAEMAGIEEPILKKVMPYYRQGLIKSQEDLQKFYEVENGRNSVLSSVKKDDTTREFYVEIKNNKFISDRTITNSDKKSIEQTINKKFDAELKKIFGNVDYNWIEPEDKKGDYNEVVRIIKYQVENPREPSTVQTEVFLKKYPSLVEKIEAIEKEKQEQIKTLKQVIPIEEIADEFRKNGQIEIPGPLFQYAYKIVAAKTPEFLVYRAGGGFVEEVKGDLDEQKRKEQLLELVKKYSIITLEEVVDAEIKKFLPKENESVVEKVEEPQAQPENQTQEKIGEVVYYSTPNKDGSFNLSSERKAFTPGASIHKVEKLGNGKYSVSIGEQEDAIKLALQYPEKSIDPIYEANNALNLKAKGIKTIEPAIFRKEGNKLILEKKGLIEYIGSEETTTTKPAALEKVGDVKYFAIPLPDGSFESSYGTDTFNKNQSYFKAEKLKDEKITVTFENQKSAIVDAYNSPELILYPIFKIMNERTPKKPAMFTVTKPALYKMIGEKLVLQKKGELYYGEAPTE